MSDLDLTFKLKADSSQGRRELNAFASEAKKVTADAERESAQQARAAESLQRQRSSALLSITRAMEGDVSKSAAQTEKNHSLTDKLIADSQRAIASAERSAAGAAASVEKVGARIAVAGTEAAGAAGQWEALAGVLSGPVVVGVGAAVAAVLGLGAVLVKFIGDTTEAGDQLYDLAQQTNYSVETLSAWQNAAETSGTTIQTIVSSLAIFNKNLGQTDEAGSKVGKTLAALNVVQGDQETTLRRVFKALYDLRGSYQQNEYAQALFGRGAKDVLGIINQSEGSFDAMIGRYRELGTLITTKAARDAQDYKDKLAEIRQQVEGVEREIGNHLLPTALRALSGISEALKRNKQDFSEWSKLLIDLGEGSSILLKPFLQMEEVLVRLGALMSPLIQGLRAIRELRDYFAGPQAQGTIDTSSLSQRNRGLYQGQGVNVPEGLRYDQSKADATYNASQFAGADAFVKQQEDAEKKAEADRKRRQSEQERDAERQANIIKQVSQAYAEASIRVTRYGQDALELEAALYKLSIGYNTLSDANKKLAQDEINKLFSAKFELRRLEAANTLQKALNQTIDEAQQAARGEKTHVDEVNEALGRFVDAGAKSDETLRKLTQRALFFANQRDLIESFDKMAAAMEKMGQVPVGAGPEAIPFAVGKGPFVDPTGLEPPPDGPSKWELFAESVNKSLESISATSVNTGQMVGGLFHGMAGAMQQSIQAWLLYGGSLGKMVKQALAQVLASLAAEAAVKAIFQLAEGFAMLFLNPPKAAAHFHAAALYGAAAVAAGVGARAFAGGGGSPVTSGAYSSGGSASSNANSYEDNRTKYNREQAERDRYTNREDRRGGQTVIQLLLDGKVAAQTVLDHVRDGGDLRMGYKNALGVTT